MACELVYHLRSEGCILEDILSVTDKIPEILPSPGDMVTIVRGNQKVVNAMMVTDRAYVYNADTGNARLEIVLQDPEEVHAFNQD